LSVESFFFGEKVLKGLREISMRDLSWAMNGMEWAKLGQNMKGESGPPPDIFRKRAKSCAARSKVHERTPSGTPRERYAAA
jgi:hypothetical protein